MVFNITAGDKFSWFRDEEFSRQTLAGLNPYSIQLVSVSLIIDIHQTQIIFFTYKRKKLRT